MDTEISRQPGNGHAVRPGVRGRVCGIAARQPEISRPSGFQLVESIIVVAMISITGLIAVPSFSTYLDKTNRITAETDITAIAATIEQYHSARGVYPDTLAAIGKQDMRDPWGTPYYYLKIECADLKGKGKDKRKCKGKGKLRKDKNLSPVNSDFDLYSAGKDKQTRASFLPPVSHDDIVRASNGRFLGYAADF